MPEHDDLQAVQELNDAYRLITERLAQVIVGQQQVIEELLVAMFARGHCLLVGVPGLAKTLMIRTLADALSLEFRRIQFTPDLMPSDITGTEVIQEDRSSGNREFRFLPGPIFGNVILADEINRTPPKTQAALLEAMQEYQITAGGQRHQLSQPFFVLATQNPIEHEGTYPLPEAQLDRFMFNTFVDYPEEEEEFDIVRRTTADLTSTVTPALSGERILELQKTVRRVPVADHVVRYAMKLVRLTRPRPAAAGKRDEVPQFIRDYVSWAPDRGRASSSSWGRRAVPSCRAASAPARTTSAPWRFPCSGIASSRTSTPRPKASSPRISCGGCSTRWMTMARRRKDCRRSSERNGEMPFSGRRHAGQTAEPSAHAVPAAAKHGTALLIRD